MKPDNLFVLNGIPICCLRNLRKVCKYAVLSIILILSACGLEKTAWEKAQEINTIQAYEEFLQNYPQGSFTQTAKDKLSQSWWSISLLKSSVKGTVSIGNSLNGIQINPDPGTSIATLEIEVTALRGDTGRIPERLEPFSAVLDTQILNYLSFTSDTIIPRDTSAYQIEMSSERGLWEMLHKAPDVSGIKTQLFISNNVKLAISPQDSLTPVYAELEGFGTRVTDDGQYFYPMGRFDPERDFVAYFLRRNILAGWFQPGKKVNVTLFFLVPESVHGCKLVFYNSPAIGMYLY